MSYSHPYHARFSPKKATFGSTSSPSKMGVPAYRTISEVTQPAPFWSREDHHPRSTSNPSASSSRAHEYLDDASESSRSARQERSTLSSSHLPPTFASPYGTTFAQSHNQDQGGLLPSPMVDASMAPFDPFSSVHNHPPGSDFVRRGSETPSYASTSSSASSFTCSPYPPPPVPQRAQRPPSSAMAFVFPSHPPPPPPMFAGSPSRAPPPAPLQPSKTSFHAPGTTPPLNVISYSPFFRDEETDEDLTSYYFTSQSDSSSFGGTTPFEPEVGSYADETDGRPSTMYSIQTTPTASPVTPKFPKKPSQMSEQEKYKDDLRAYTRGLLRGVHRAASEPAEEVGMGAWTKAGGIQEDVDMENGDSVETLVGGSLGRRVRRKGRNASEGGRGFREVAVFE